MNILGTLQRLGRALMLPIAVLPVAALLLRLGAPDLLDIPFVMKGGGALFDNLPLLFAIGVAVGLARDNAGAAGLAGAVGYLTLIGALKALDKTLDMGVLAGMIMGATAGLAYNRWQSIKLPEWLGFFGGRRFVPIATGGAAIVLAGVFSVVWPPIQAAIAGAGNWIIGAGPLGTFVYGVLNRLLIPTGLHHIINNLIWFQFGDFAGPTGQVVHGDLHRFFAGDPAAGVFMAGFFPVMMFGLPAACLAMYATAKSDRRRAVAGVLASVALTSFATGITEPIEYLFMFLAPALYVVHALLTGLSLALCGALGIRMGFGFSAGAFDFVLNRGLGSGTGELLAVGAGFFVVYFLLFLVAIRAMDLKTPGREEEPAPEAGDKASGPGRLDVAGPDPGLSSAGVPASGAGAQGQAPDSPAALARGYLAALGGAGNLAAVDSCITRLRLAVRDQGAVDEAALRVLGAKGLVRLGGQGLQVVVGTQAELVASALSALLAGER